MPNEPSLLHQFLSVKVSGNAKEIALWYAANQPVRKASAPHSVEPGDIGRDLSLSVWEVEQAWIELRHPLVAWLVGAGASATMPADALPRRLVATTFKEANHARSAASTH